LTVLQHLQSFPPPSTKHQIMEFLNLTGLHRALTSTLHLVESLPRRVEAVIAAKGGPTPY
uniref:Uncharacterized protein n=1 Tax=Salmo trutta TaxID=8032 RepID=A0A673Y5G3_SALTR